MVGMGKELVVRDTASAAVDLREVAAKATLREVRQKGGHIYVELRRVGRRVIFFCTICLTPCYSDNSLFDHLKGNLHARRYAGAKVTLFGPVPWPFNDGVLFFNNAREEDPLVLDLSPRESRGAIVPVPCSAFPVQDSDVTLRASDGSRPHASNSLRIMVASPGNQWRSSDLNGAVIIPRVLCKDRVSDLGVHLLGIGNILYKICEDKEDGHNIGKIWCAWVGGRESSDDRTNQMASSLSDFAIVDFSYAYCLGRKQSSGIEDSRLLPGSSYFMINDAGCRGKKRKKSFSDQEASSEDSNGQCSHGSDYQITNRAMEDADTSRQLQVHSLSSKKVKNELRKQKRFAAERACDICGQPILPGKDVGTLLNCKTGNLACSSRNSSGAFHLFHTSCLIHWNLLCEYEMLRQPIVEHKPKGAKGKSAAKSQITSVLCPECQGTGIPIEGDEFEKPSVPLSEMFRYKLRALEAHKAWMKDPEVIQNYCSTGLKLSSSPESSHDLQKAILLKSLRFYGASV